MSGTIGVTPAVFEEVLRHSGLTIAEVNALPFETRQKMVAEARVRLLPKVERSAAGAEIRAERERRKRLEWEKRQPK